jgi:hypothetical protein
MNFKYLLRKSNQIFFCLVLLHLLILVNTKFTVWPEMVLYPWLQTKGFLLYKDIINPYFPLLPLVLYGVFSVFGSSVLTLKIFTWGLILVADSLIYYSALRLSKDFIRPFLAVIVFILLQTSFGGNALWFELAIGPLLIPALVLIFLDYQKPKRVLIAGILLSLTVLTKQNAIIFFLPVIIYLYFKKQIRNSVYLLIPGLILGIITFVYLISIGIWADFYFWTVNLTLNYTSQPGFVSLPTKKQYLLILFPATVVIGLLANRRIRFDDKVFWLFVILGSLVFAFPRYENFHLQVVVAVGALISVLVNKKIFVAFFIISLLLFGNFLIKNWHKPDRFIDDGTLKLAQKIESFNSVYLLNSPDLAYFFANKVPSKPWATNFSWYFEQPGFEEKFIYGLSNTEHVVIGERQGGGYYDLGNYIPGKLLNHIEQNYAQVERYGQYNIWRKK